MTFTDTETMALTITKTGLKQYIKDHDLLKSEQLYLRLGGFRNNVVIAGGYFANTLQGVPFKDIDIFVINNDVGVYNELTTGFRAQKSAQKKPVSLDDASTLFDAPEWSRSEMMSYMSNPNIVDVINNNKTKAQYILTRYNTREELISHFDYKHCRVSYVPDDDMLYISRETYDCIKNKVLKVNNKKPNPNQKYRLARFLQSGWKEDVVEDKQLYSNILMESYERLKEQIASQSLSAPVIAVDGFVAQTMQEIFAKSK